MHFRHFKYVAPRICLLMYGYVFTFLLMMQHAIGSFSFFQGRDRANGREYFASSVLYNRKTTERAED